MIAGSENKIGYVFRFELPGIRVGVASQAFASEVGRIDYGYNGIALARGIDTLVNSRGEQFAAVLQIACSPDKVIARDGDSDGEIAKVVVELLRSKVGNAVPAVDIVIDRDPGKEIGDEKS